MQTVSVCTVNGAKIQVGTDDRQLVPIRPICDALGVNYPSQANKLKSHPILGSTVLLSNTVGGDEKQRDMLCIPLRYVFGWLMTINPDNVSDAARDVIIRYQLECYDALFNHFYGRTRRMDDLDRREMALLREKSDVMDEIADKAAVLKETKTRLGDIESSLIEIRNERHNPQPCLFD